MALYEGIALIQEKQAVVLDLGSEYTKFGFTGEAAPRCIVRSQFWSPELRRHKRVFDYRSDEELYDNLVNMLHLLYFRHVLVNPKERRVVVVESLLAPTRLRETLARVLFDHYEVSGVAWADSPRLCAMTLGAPVVLVVEIGAREAEVNAVVHGSVVLRAMQAAPLGAGAVRAELARLLAEDNPGVSLEPDELEDIMVKACLVPNRSRALQWSTASPPAAAAPATARARAGAVRVTARARELAAEPLFARDAELSSLPDLVLQCIMQVARDGNYKCPIDARRALAENILVAGGGAALAGLRARLRHELLHALTLPPYSERLHLTSLKFHSAPAHANATAWLGGALLAGGEARGAGAGSREHWARARRLRDWVCLLDNTPPDHPARENREI